MVVVGPVLDLAEADTSSPCDLDCDGSLGRLSAWMQSLDPCGFSLDFDLHEQPIPEVHQSLTPLATGGSWTHQTLWLAGHYRGTVQSRLGIVNLLIPLENAPDKSVPSRAAESAAGMEWVGLGGGDCNFADKCTTSYPRLSALSSGRQRSEYLLPLGCREPQEVGPGSCSLVWQSLLCHSRAEAGMSQARFCLPFPLCP